MNWLLNLLGGGIADQLRRAYEAKLAAQNDAERIAAEIQISQLEARKASLVAGGLITSVVQFLWAVPFIAFNAKIIVWDRMLGWGSTPELSQTLLNIEWTMVGFYFLTTAIRR